MQKLYKVLISIVIIISLAAIIDALINGHSDNYEFENHSEIPNDNY